MRNLLENIAVIAGTVSVVLFGAVFACIWLLDALDVLVVP